MYCPQVFSIVWLFNYLLRRLLVNLLSIKSILLLNIKALNCNDILINRIWFFYYLHFDVFCVTRPYNFCGNFILLFLGCLISQSLVFCKFLLFLFILSCVWRNLSGLSLCIWLFATLFMFFYSYFSARLWLDVGQFEVILTLSVWRWILIYTRNKVALSAWLSFTHLLILTFLKLRSICISLVLPPFLFLFLLSLF